MVKKIIGTPYEFVFVPIDACEYDLTTTSGVIQALANSGNKTAEIRSQYVTGTYYLEGDYSPTYDYLNEMLQKETDSAGSLGSYALLTRNCAQVSWRALAESNIRIAITTCPIIPNTAYIELQMINDMSEFTYNAYRYFIDNMFVPR